MAKRVVYEQMSFWGKSLLWSLCLYAAAMLTIYREDIRNILNGSPVAANVHVDSETRSSGAAINITAARHGLSLIERLSRLLSTSGH